MVIGNEQEGYQIMADTIIRGTADKIIIEADKKSKSGWIDT